MAEIPPDLQIMYHITCKLKSKNIQTWQADTHRHTHAQTHAHTRRHTFFSRSVFLLQLIVLRLPCQCLCSYSLTYGVLVDDDFKKRGKPGCECKCAQRCFYIHRGITMLTSTHWHMYREADRLVCNRRLYWSVGLGRPRQECASSSHTETSTRSTNRTIS